ncbi:non-ribosomal peptide synthetase module [Paenibacillus lutrae]|uniref:Non-ribosomal peptide synthetase module n=1 Tax=Paenibacillus lutrae TaxID=2078573 RepID=A0A7X3FIP6_9BACL|nr:non-ribosomal peptide synthetase module [Paenibacillus lutrae]MVP00511.1 non-ribosomal peptide synthetase module [Paenibacillus lutrae]
MAQRLATEYVKTRLHLTEAEMSKFVQMFADHQVTSQVKVIENGNQEFVFQEEAGEEIVLSFERVGKQYISSGTCRVTSLRLTNVLRKAIAEFKGSAVVKRIYATFVMIYTYELGRVVKIVEVKGSHTNVVFEYQDTLGQLEKLFRRTEIEREISMIHDQINHLLDMRNEVSCLTMKLDIDSRLTQLTRRLFILEA